MGRKLTVRFLATIHAKQPPIPSQIILAQIGIASRVVNALSPLQAPHKKGRILADAAL